MEDTTVAEPETGADASLEPESETEVEDQGKESEAESPPAEETEDKPDPFQERIDKLTRRFRETERDLDAVARERDDYRRKLDELSKTPPREEKAKSLSDFDYDEGKYQQYVWSEAERRAELAAQRVAEGMTSKLEAERRQEQFRKREATFAKTVDDYEEVVQDRYLPISPVMADEIRGSDIGPELAYYLGKHPEEASEIARSAPQVAIRKMVALEGRLQSQKSNAKGNKVSKAPPPPSKTVKGAEPGLRVATTDPASDKMSDEEWFKREALRQAKLRGR